MNAQWIVVALVVVAAALYAAWRLMPGMLRLRVRRALGLRQPASTSPATECERCSTPHH